jgi:ornithine carbamoyltransferase
MTQSTFESARALDERYVMPTYSRFPALFVRGKGCLLWDSDGGEYLDFLAGIAVCSLGHCHPAVAGAISRQAHELMHCSNLLLSAPVSELAKKLCEISGMDRAFFATDGAGANETMIKLAKTHGLRKRPEGDYEILALSDSFHGRTLGALSATGQPKYQRDFAPLLGEFRFVAPNDMAALRERVSDKTAAVLLEPIQGETGVVPLTTEFLKEALRLCEENDALLLLDEVQTGIGRTGTWFNFQQHGIVPDAVALAKGLGSGMPVGACLARGRAAELFALGSHGSTFGGNPLMCAASLAVIDTIERQDLLAHVRETGAYLADRLASLGGPVVEVRGAGLMLAARLDKPIAKEIVKACFERKLIVNAPAEDVLRFVPPLVVTKQQADQAVERLAEVLGTRAPSRRGALPPKAARLGDVLSIDDLDADTALDLLHLAAYLKDRRRLAPSEIRPVEGRTVALVFEKPSLRTRVSFEAAIQELGGHAVYLSKLDIDMGRREAIKDVASNLGRWCSVVVARLFWQRHLLELADYCEAPVVNALTEMEHPCQALADMLTVREAHGEERAKITYVGDANNVARSLAKLAVKLGYPFCLCGPKNFWLEPMEGVTQTESLEEGLAGAKVVYTDVWVSMGDEHEQEHRLKVFEPYQVSSSVMALADQNAVFLHCLPARRGFEVTDEVMDGPQSRVVDQAENRLHVQKALLQRVLAVEP